MKKLAKLLTVTALVVVSVFALAACGGGSVVGDWEATEAKMITNGITVDMIETGATISLSLKEDENFTMVITLPATFGGGSESFDGTWKKDGNKVTLTMQIDAENAPSYLTYSGGKLVVDESVTEGEVTVKTKMTFVKK